MKGIPTMYVYPKSKKPTAEELKSSSTLGEKSSSIEFSWVKSHPVESSARLK